jgi:TetR/AcrR family transcriptional regulator, regulator of cefoperazone and chloramphenicol sensitivity
VSDAKAALIRAGEHLFARNGIHQTRVRELNELAGQRNASALHYHFGTREGLLRAIYERHSGIVDAERAERFAELTEDATLHEVVGVILGPMVSHLDRPDGRDYLRILPGQLIGMVEPPAVIAAFAWARRLLDRSGLPTPIRDERLMSMLLAGTTLIAQRARAIEDGDELVLDADAFRANLIDMATGLLTAPVAAAALAGA